jgi:hypothetical protein
MGEDTRDLRGDGCCPTQIPPRPATGGTPGDDSLEGRVFLGDDVFVFESVSEQVWYGGGTMDTRFLTEHPLKIASELRGAELASPLRRRAAFVLDFAVLRDLARGSGRV